MPSRSPGGPGTVEVVPGVVALTGLAGLPPEEAEAVARVTALVEEAFVAGHHRVEAEVEPDDRRLRRVLQRSGLRPEGVSRGRGPRETGDGGGGGGGAAYRDLLRLARLVDDPEPGTPAAFLAMLDATLPLKRVIVQGLVHDGVGRLLLCELTYKKEWDLVGGVAEPAESPVESLAREVREELGVELPVGDLIGVDWLPPYRQWRDALLLVFDLGVHPDLAERAVLQRSELADLRWCTVEEAEGRVAPYVHRLLASLREAHETAPGHVLFLEDGLPRAAR
ncbi:NUDIX hydrolase [Ornithinimicrobium tianjinense]|uniref:Nudix hydrolase domain-containing protein n=1 Tax=Ornithinimicrobium tianjinense TaxID=1195761 RepID=A0A917BD51_9MICO|nr:NUDIX hydrolase [Ornithinimicrobium tianjinense]GGF36477.1 hypothetical protein GCM10011366_00150 [Ornithinimicrobium tianjinense]